MNQSSRQFSKAEQVLARFGRWVIRRRGWALVGLVVVTAVLATGIPRITIDNSNEMWFADGDQTVAEYAELKRVFGNDTFIFFLYETDDVFTAASLGDLDTIEARLSGLEYKGEPIFESITHIGNVSFVLGDSDVVEVVELGAGLERDPEGLAAMRDRAYSTPVYEGLLVDRDAKTAGMLATITPRPNDGDFHTVLTETLRAELATAPLGNMRLTMAGGPILDSDMDQTTGGEAIMFGLLSLLLNLIVMGFLFRRIAGVAIPMFVVLTTLTWTFGIMGFVGVSVNVIIVILPALLVAVSISDSVHILSEYQTERAHGLDRNDAIVHTVAQVGLACLLTTATTAAGMASLTLAPLPPIKVLGVSAAVGVIAAYVITMFAVPAILSFTGLPAARSLDQKASSVDRWTRALEALAAFTVRRARPIVAVSAVLIVAATAAASTVVLETDFVESFKESFPTRRAFDKIDSTLGGTASLQMVIDTGEEGGVKDPEFLRKLAGFQQWVEDNHPKVVQTLSLADLVMNMNQVLGENDRTQYRIPDSRAAVAQELMLYENSDPDGLFELVTDDYRTTRVDMRTTSGGTKMAAQMMDESLAEAQRVFGPSADIHFSGISYLFVVMFENLSRGQIYSYLAAFAMILLMMIAVLKSPSLGLLSMIPNTLPIIITLGFMGIVGLRLDFITLLIACVAIGIAVDDTIHFLVRFKKELESSGDYAVAISRSMVSVGRAMSFTTLILTLGFLMFVPSVSLSVATFGVLVALTVVIALLADLLVMPAILVAFKPVRTVQAPSSAGSLERWAIQGDSQPGR